MVVLLIAMVGCWPPHPPDAGACSLPTSIATYENRFVGTFPGVALGVGLNSLTGAPAGSCLNIEQPGQCVDRLNSVEFRSVFIQNASELRQQLGASVAAGADTPFFSGETSAAFASSSATRSDSSYLYLEASVQLDTDVTPSVALSPDKAQILQRDPVGFLAACGDSYISNITSGGLFRAIYEFKHLTDASKKDLSAALSLSGIDWSVDASYRASVQTFLDRFESRLYVFQEGGVAAIAPVTIDGLLTRAREFVGTINCKTAVPIRAGTKTYYTVSGLPPGMRIPSLQEARNALADVIPQLDAARVSLMMLKIDWRGPRGGSAPPPAHPI
jgi:hypothetical protein